MLIKAYTEHGRELELDVGELKWLQQCKSCGNVAKLDKTKRWLRTWLHPVAISLDGQRKWKEINPEKLEEFVPGLKRFGVCSNCARERSMRERKKSGY